jgi:hypothetical protein
MAWLTQSSFGVPAKKSWGVLAISMHPKEVSYYKRTFRCLHWVGRKWHDYALEVINGDGVDKRHGRRETCGLGEVELKLQKALLRKCCVKSVRSSPSSRVNILCVSHIEDGTDGTSIYLTRDIGGVIGR